jgi:FKBP12-rapamycin complex-associated protein
MSSTPGDELSRILWDKNDTCEQWLEYRRLYAHTLAIMSMVGYVLGLGDRHLNNLMLQQGGAVVHIDFGDCFEVAMHRLMYGERVPFRLTRLLVHALGVTGVDGVYRHTCEHVMKLLRRHKDNLLSVLEAFIYDPLINWKLKPKEDSTSAVAVAGNAGAAVPMPAKQDPIPLLVDDSDLGKAALSCTVRGRQFAKSDEVEVDDDQELRNQQAHVALLRVHGKLSGQDFIPSTPHAAGAAASHLYPTSPDRTLMADLFGESLKDSVAGPLLLASYFAHHQPSAGSSEMLGVPQQVERLIQEATSLDNLAEAYITGWAPFW